MKGLLYKDFLVLRRQMWSFLILIAVFCIIPNDTFFNLGLFFVVYTSLLPMSLMAYDERARWDRLAPMLPVTRGEIVRSKYAMGCILALAAGVLYCAGRAFHGSFAPGQALGAVAVALIFQAVLYPVLFRYGVEKGRIAMGVMTGLIVFLCLQFDFVPKGHSYGEAVTLTGGPVLFIVAVVLMLVSVRVSERAYARRAG